MSRTQRIILSLSLILFSAACSLPRGAALQSQVLSEEGEANPSFQVVKVTRDVTPDLAQWPATGWHGHYHWFGADHGPDSSLIQTGDSLDIVVWDNEVSSLLTSETEKLASLPTTTVSSTGNVFLPYVGEVLVRGLTREAARDRLQKELASIAPSAQVQLSVTQGRNNSVDLVSGVGVPGRYPLEGRNTTILGVLAQGGGVNPTFRHPLTQLQRRGSTYEIRVDRLLAEASKNVRVRGGDQISIVEDSRSFNVLGAAGSEQVIYFVKEEMSVMEAMSAMGGLSDFRADPKGILILREYAAKDLKPGMAGPDMQQVVFVLDLTSADGLFVARQMKINPQDTVLVTESPITTLQTIFNLVGTVVGFGVQANRI